jgi:hypothetical protein
VLLRPWWLWEALVGWASLMGWRELKRKKPEGPRQWVGLSVGRGERLNSQALGDAVMLDIQSSVEREGSHCPLGL